MTSTPAYRQGEQEEEKELVGNHDIRSGNGRWAGLRYVGRLNLFHESTFKGGYWNREIITI